MRKYIEKLNLISNDKKVIEELLDEKNISLKQCIFLNTHSYVETLKNNIFMKSVLRSKYVFADGIGIHLASKLFFNKLNLQRITGYDFFENLLMTINNSQKNKKLFFIGGEKSNLLILKEKIVNEYKNIKSENIRILSPPFGENFKFRDEDIIENINSFDPDIIFVGLGAPKQEIWSYLNIKKINCVNYINIGAAFNFFTGLEKRAPHLLRKYGFEWLFRLLITPKKIYKRVFVSGAIFIYFFFCSYFLKKNYYKIIKKYISVNLVRDFEDFDWNSGYILSALNLASLSFLYKEKILISKRIFFWGDGIFHKFMIRNSKKIPGSKLIELIKYPKNIKLLHVIGNLTEKQRRFLEKKFNNLKVINSGLPYGDIKLIFKNLPILNDENELILLTLPTPKQEQVAEFYHKENPKLKIICIGGGLAIASGDEKPVPRFFDFLGLEWLWRLRYETNRRFKRLSTSALYIFQYMLYGRFLRKIIVKFLK